MWFIRLRCLTNQEPGTTELVAPGPTGSVGPVQWPNRLYNEPPHSRPPPLTCFLSIGTPLYCLRIEEVVSGPTELVVPGPTELVVPGPTRRV